MKSTFYLVIAFIVNFSAAYAEDAASNIPSESKVLIDRLEAWESEQKAKLDKEIQRKREEVVRVLEKHLEDATKAGDLDGALGIRKKITELRGLVHPGQVWTGDHPVLKGKWSMKLFAEGKAILTHGKTQHRFWAFEYPNILYCWHPAQTKTSGWKLTIDRSGKSAKVETTKGGGRGKATLKSISGE